MSVEAAEINILVAPYLYMMKEGLAEKIYEFVSNGGSFVTTTLAGLVDENNKAVFGEYPGLLRDLLGIWVRTDALSGGKKWDADVRRDAFRKPIFVIFQCDRIHARKAQVLGVYEKDFYAQTPCLTVNTYGKGKAYYIGTEPDGSFLSDFLSLLCEEKQIAAPYEAAPNVEITKRVTDSGETVFVLNHNHEPAKVQLREDSFTDLITGQQVTGSTSVPAYDVMVLKKRYNQRPKRRTV